MISRSAFFVYNVLCCANGSYYVGYTDDLEKRVAEHAEGGKCSYTQMGVSASLRSPEVFPVFPSSGAAAYRGT
jgi:predicted GIY-YIG superfamily endonuclease